MRTLHFIIEPKTEEDAKGNLATIELLHDCLCKNTHTLYYLASRGVSKDASREFGLGYLPPNIITSKTLQPLQGRLIIPVYDTYGTPICLAGRTLNGGSECKYWHPSYDKKRYIWNLHRAKNSIKEKKVAVLVEGFMHVISLWDHGVRNVVSMQGTALQDERIPLLLRYTDSVIVIPDRDGPGERGWKKLARVLRATPYNLQVVRLKLPEGYNDIDEFINKASDTETNPILDALRVPWVAKHAGNIDTIKLRQVIEKRFGYVLPPES